jgi:hypothetical protein
LHFKVHCILEALMDGSTTVPPDEAARTLMSIRSTRERTRADLRSYWYPLVIFGVLTLLSTPFFDLWDGAGAGVFWLVAAPAGMAAVARHYRRREFRAGLTVASRPYVVTAACLLTACFALGFGGGIAGNADVASFGPPLAVAVAYVVFAWLERSVLLALLAFALAGLTVALALADVARANQIVAAADGASFVLLGLLARTWTPRR